MDYEKKQKLSKEALYAAYYAAGMQPFIPTAGNSEKIPYGQLKKYFNTKGNNGNNGNGNNGNGNNPDTTTTAAKPGKYENLQFFYHPDHLGSSNYITDASGEVYQHNEYFPYGETFVEERNAAEYTNYLFSGKELDEETGFYYFGARYYNSRISTFASCEPMIDDFPDISPYSYCANNPVKLVDPDGNSPTLITAAIGAGIGAIVGAGIEAGTQLYKSGSVTNWKAVGGAAAQGAITGGVAGLTGGASLVATAVVAGTANAVGGTVNRAIQGKGTTLGDVAFDATIGAGLGVAGHKIGSFVKGAADDLSNAAKGKIGEAATSVKYGVQGYKSSGKAIVETGKKTATGKTQVAKYDHDMTNIFTGKKLTVESKFNTSTLTPNQTAARANVTTPGGLIINRTTSQQLGNAAKSIVTGTSGQIHSQKD